MGLEPTTPGLKDRYSTNWVTHRILFCYFLHHRLWPAYSLIELHNRPQLHLIFAGLLPRSPFSVVFTLWHDLHNNWHFCNSLINFSSEQDVFLPIVKDFVEGSIWSNCKSSVPPHETHFPPNSVIPRCFLVFHLSNMYCFMYSLYCSFVFISSPLLFLYLVSSSLQIMYYIMEVRSGELIRNLYQHLIIVLTFQQICKH